MKSFMFCQPNQYEQSQPLTCLCNIGFRCFMFLDVVFYDKYNDYFTNVEVPIFKLLHYHEILHLNKILTNFANECNIFQLTRNNMIDYVIENIMPLNSTEYPILCKDLIINFSMNTVQRKIILYVHHMGLIITFHNWKYKLKSEMSEYESAMYNILLLNYDSVFNTDIFKDSEIIGYEIRTIPH